MADATLPFSTLDISPALLQVVAELGFDRLTPIQSESIPALLKGRDLIGQSRTGSGKTAAYALPILQKLGDKLGQDSHAKSAQAFNRDRNVQALILCPTRELCSQVAREIRKLGRRHPGLQVIEISGGQPIFPQLTALEKGVHIVVGTPGRVLDHLSRRSLDLSKVSTFVLDEADRMLDMGFQEDMELILSKLPEERQTVFFSATFPKTIEAMSRAFQVDPVRVTIADEVQSVPDIEQTVYELTDEASGKLKALSAALKEHRPESAIVFCNLKATVKDVAQALSRSGLSAAGIHGDLEQFDRDRVMAKFRNQSTRILVATDVAARGIDIESLDLVVNFDLPPDPEVYVHRIGRTGRAGRKGHAISLASSREKMKIKRIEDYTGTPLKRIALEDPDDTAPQSAEVRIASESQAPAGGFLAKMATLIIAGGRKDKMRPGDILGALTGEAGGLDASDVGKIEIHDRFSYVAVTQGIAQLAVERLTNGRIKGRKFRVELVR